MSTFMPNPMQKIGALIAAALATAMLGSIFSTQSVISSLNSLNVDVSMGDRLFMTINDFYILIALGPITLICFAISFIVAGFCHRLLGGNRTAWHIVAGATSLIATLFIIKAVVLVTLIAGTRTLLGLLSFAVAGAIGGWVYAKITAAKETEL